MHEAARASARAPAELDTIDAVGDDIVSQKYPIRVFPVANLKQASSDAQDAAWAPLCALTQVGNDRAYYNRMVAEEMRHEWDVARSLAVDANENVQRERQSGIAYGSLLSCSGDKMHRRPMLMLEESAEAIDVLALVQVQQEENSPGRISKSIEVCECRR